jgi:Outer membrane protein beta-barrel domain
MFFKRKPIKIYIVYLLLLISYNVSNCFGQSVFFNRVAKNGIYKPKPFKYSTLSLGVGSTHFYGDVGPENFLKAVSKNMGWNISLSYSYALSKKIQIGANLSYIRLVGDDFYADNDLNYIRNLHFRNDIKQLSFFFQYHPLSYSTDYKKRLAFSPYVTVGAGYFFHNPETKLPQTLGDRWVDLQPQGTEGQGLNPVYSFPYKLSGFALPLGLGVRYKYNSKIDLSFEITYHILFTDYIDDVSRIYPNPLLISNEITEALSNRSREPFSSSTGQSRADRIISFLKGQGEDTSQPFSSNNPAFGLVGSDRGNSLNNDSYMITSLRIHFILPESTLKCPKLR